jgi:anti-sigma regulatory factor (Ser/Thr protein kinase)
VAKIQLPAKFENLEKVQQFVSSFAEKRGFTQKRIKALELATEEVVVNIIRYAYPEDSGTVEVSCGVDENDRIIIEIMDTGTPFNPLSQSKPNLSDDIAERKIGGLGIFFIRMMMDQVKYRHENGKNILTLIPHQE